MVDINGELLVHDMLVDRWTIDDSGDRDELFTGGVWPRADAGDQEVTADPVRTRAATSHDPGCRERDHGPDEHDDDREFQHTVMVGLLP